MPGDRLDARHRSAALEALASTAKTGQPLDILVIGGGITGAGIAVDAASRGLKVGIIEADDWASGTSSRSSNLVHGGLRYLQMLDFKLVWEALGERELLLHTIAPHLVRPQPFIFPLQHRFWQRIFIGAGIALYDLMATVRRGKRSVPMHRHLSRRGLLRRFPSLRKSAFIGAIEYWDATIDDAAMVTALVRTAAGHGAVAATRVRATGVTRNLDGRVDGVIAEDTVSGDSFVVAARNVIVATGVWTEETESAADGDKALEVLASKGVHISVPRSCIDGDTAIIHQTETSVLFLIPAASTWIIGTTDTPWDQPRDRPLANDTDIEYLLDQVNELLDRPIRREDVLSFWAGLRPLLQPTNEDGDAPSKVSREHTVASVTPGVSAIAGGKLTTYRVMAEDAVDFALGDRARTLPSVTDRVVIAGSDGLESPQEMISDLCEKHGWDDHIADRLLRRFGSRIAEIGDLCAEDPSLSEPLTHAPDHIRAEIVHAVVFEGALSIGDVIRRRTRMSREVIDLGAPTADEVADLVAPYLDWGPEMMRWQVARYRRAVAAEMAASRAQTDVEAVRKARDILDGGRNGADRLDGRVDDDGKEANDR